MPTIARGARYLRPVGARMSTLTRDAESGATPLAEVLLEDRGAGRAAGVLAVALKLLHHNVVAIEDQLERLRSGDTARAELAAYGSSRGPAGPNWRDAQSKHQRRRQYGCW